MRCAWLAIILVGAVACGSKSSQGEARDAVALVDKCVAGYEKAVTSKSFRRQLFWDTCAGIYREALCRHAFQDAATVEPSARAASIYTACRDAYCPTLPSPKPSACDAGESPSADAMRELMSAVWRSELGDREAERLEAELRKLGTHKVEIGSDTTVKNEVFTKSVGVKLPPPGEGPAPPADALVIHVGDGVIMLEGEELAKIAEIEAQSGNRIDPLFERLKEHPGRRLVLEASNDTSETVINRVLKTAYATDHKDVYFNVLREKAPR